MSGWGASLGFFLPLGTVVRNFAKGGATTDSLRADGLWNALLSELEPADLVLLQLGHNDQKSDAPDAVDHYRDNLAAMVADVHRRAGRPVLCTSVQRRRFDGGRLVDTHGAFPTAVRELASELTVPLVDLTRRTTALLESRGEDGSRRLFTHLPPGAHPNYPDGVADDTHFAYAGADAVAEIVAREIQPFVEENVTV
ncbi:rhamnogalacturonan acetylesterase [Georgenia halophila]|uniref:Rhamnogalacturonan acetylesterase n=2 Tax=Georgenia halophila TaxID=620889 RepID=A0ABP8LG30_9MICO